MPCDGASADENAVATLRLIGPTPPNWVPDREGVDHNVAIIGGGQSGSALGFALRRAGIGKVSIIEAAEEEDQAGIWLTAARMNLLRTPKSLVGPEIGLPALGFQAWYEARHGREAYAAIDRIRRTDWAAYLIWYRAFLDIPARYGTKLLHVEPRDGCFALQLDVGGVRRVETARKIILATGFHGSGGNYIPSFLTANVPARLYAHTEQVIDFASLRGKMVGVIGAAASAFDAAGVALENGAAEVHLFARRAAIASLPVARARMYQGAYDNYYELPDLLRWRLAVRFRAAGSSPTVDAIERAVKFPNFHLHLAAPWTDARPEDGRVVGWVDAKEFRCDFVIAATGYFADPNARPELAGIAPKIMLWRDRLTEAASDAYLGAHPYLGAGHEYLPRDPGGDPAVAGYLRDIHVQNPSGFVSFGLPIGDVPSMRRDIPAIVARISRDLFQTDAAAHEQRMFGDVAPDFPPELYASALRR
ncbi:MAG: NAD(P)/FAD-dependent oxidoreductase [Acetobacteraceae bacterium]|nr:NAD(P)/FAD-dependent oxidoreductase [Acetobacteraceae bacterium]